MNINSITSLQKFSEAVESEIAPNEKSYLKIGTDRDGERCLLYVPQSEMTLYEKIQGFFGFGEYKLRNIADFIKSVQPDSNSVVRKAIINLNKKIESHNNSITYRIGSIASFVLGRSVAFLDVPLVHLPPEAITEPETATVEVAPQIIEPPLPPKVDKIVVSEEQIQLFKEYSFWFQELASKKWKEGSEVDIDITDSLPPETLYVFSKLQETLTMTKAADERFDWDFITRCLGFILNMDSQEAQDCAHMIWTPKLSFEEIQHMYILADYLKMDRVCLQLEKKLIRSLQRHDAQFWEEKITGFKNPEARKAYREIVSQYHEILFDNGLITQNTFEQLWHFAQEHGCEQLSRELEIISRISNDEMEPLITIYEPQQCGNITLRREKRLNMKLVEQYGQYLKRLDNRLFELAHNYGDERRTLLHFASNIETLHLDSQYWPKQEDENKPLLLSNKLKTLHLNHVLFDGNRYLLGKALEPCTELENLIVTESFVLNAYHVDIFKGIQPLKKLKQINFHSGREMAVESLGVLFKNSPILETLDLGSSLLTLPEVELAPTVKELNLQSVRYTLETLKKVLKKCTKLEKLNLTNYKGSLAGIVFSPSLKELKLGCAIGFTGDELHKALEPCTEFEKLDLSMADGRSLDGLTLPSSLKRLSIRSGVQWDLVFWKGGWSVSSFFIQNPLAHALRNCTALEVLDLSWNGHHNIEGLVLPESVKVFCPPDDASREQILQSTEQCPEVRLLFRPLEEEIII